MPIEVVEKTYGSAARRKELEKAARKSYRKLGGGAFAKVYAKNRTTVVKIGPMSDNYVSYVRALIANDKPSPFLLVIHKVTWYVPTDKYAEREREKVLRSRGWVPGYWKASSTGFYVIEMERLERLDLDKREYEHVAWKFSETLTWGKPPSKTLMTLPMLKKASKKVKESLNHALKVMRKAHRDVGACWDIHNGNIMLRGTQLVVTDPLS